MKHTIIILMITLALTSCAQQFRMAGTTDVHALEGATLYLMVYDESEDLAKLDSCQVTHGKFEFRGTLDTATMANLFVGRQSIMPVVIEAGELTISIGDMGQSVQGSPLNDSLSSFISQKTQIDNQIAMLSQKEGRMVMDGLDFDEVVARLSAEFAELTMQSDGLVTNFIRRNYNNVLGPGIFMIMTSGYPYSIITPQIEEILTHATPYFMGNPYVKAYLKKARENMESL